MNGLGDNLKDILVGINLRDQQVGNSDIKLYELEERPFDLEGD
jgi:hypothetical protein